MRRVALALAGCVLLGACAARPPKGVDEIKLDEAIGAAIGDPNTCVVLAKAGSGKILWRYQALNECARRLPACDRAGNNSAEHLAKIVARGAAVTAGCGSVGWAGGPTPREGVVYAAVMQGGHALPGIEIARRLDEVFKDTGF